MDSCAVSVRVWDASENENPGALAGATGTQSKSIEDLPNEGRNGGTPTSPVEHEDAARLYADVTGVLGLLRAVFEIDPADRLTVLESVYDDLRAGSPAFAADHDVMDWARRWAAIASPRERKAYCLACFEAMPARDRQSFLTYIDRRVAA